MTKHYGFIGLGELGAQLAANLLRAGFQVTVHDLNPAAADALIAAGANWSDSPPETAAVSDSLITCLPSPAASQTVMKEHGALAAIKPGGAWIEMSTTDAHLLQALAEQAQQRKVQVLEAPVTGGVHKAAAGTITVLVGGDENAYQAHLPAFQAMGGQVFYMGALGQASIIKVITNMLAFIHLVAAGEALMLAKRGGLDLRQAFEAIRASSGNSFVHETESQVILNGSYDIAFTMDLACKDIGFATQMGREFGVPLKLAGMVEQLFIEARQRYGGSAWSPMVVKLLEDALGEELRAPGFPARLSAEDA